jgi:AbrB family looped-hinge helix DNA binding protein
MCRPFGLRKTVCAVTRALEITSEAARRFPDDFKANHPWSISRPAAAGNVGPSPYLDLPIYIPYAILNGMTLKMDKAGRVILPKPLRDRLGLHEGSDLEITETPEGVVLKPTEQQPS